MNRLLLTVVVIGAAGCGYTSPGGGSGTLFVTARLSSDGSTSGSRARVTVRSGSMTGDIVKNAEVAIRGGPLARTVVPFDDASQQFRLDGFVWPDGIRLEVLRGNDLLDGSIEAPGATVITDPVANTTFSKSAGAPLLVRWKDARGAIASSTTLHLDKAKFDQSLPGGAREFPIDVASLVVNDKERVRVERTNEVVLAGGNSGSVLSASTEHEIEFKVE
ncbi:MAG: hypothetical protein QM817_06275 [Archangium sp.]